MQKIQAVVLFTLSLLAGCSLLPQAHPPTPCVPCKESVPVSTVEPVKEPTVSERTFQLAQWSDLPGWQADNVAEAWGAFLQSCRGMASKSHGSAWKAICNQAKAASGKADFDPRAFFEKNLRPYALMAGDQSVTGTVTGYYEPLLNGSRTKLKGYEQAVLGVPADLLTIDLASVFPELKGKRVRGRIEGNKVVPYWSRAEITERETRLPGKTLLYTDDAVELFFLQVQGSGRVKLTDGTMARLNYADQNGHPYQSIGRLLVKRGDLKLEEASMQGIQAWARANPDRLTDLLNANPSYVFFREVPNSNEGPVGALGVPLTAERSIAIDPRSVPLGAPVFLATTRPNSAEPMNRLVMAQDTGGAIKGAVRADFFWGFGKEAGEQAGRMKQSGKVWVLWPVGSAPK